MFFTFDDNAKARLHIHFSEVRLAEAEAKAMKIAVGKYLPLFGGERAYREYRQ